MPELSIVIPAHNEEDCLEGTIRNLFKHLSEASITHEILVINDNSKDQTEAILRRLMLEIPSLRYLNNQAPNGFGFAVRHGLEQFKGQSVAVYMADASDRPEDLVRFYRIMQAKNVDCVFGNRWSRESKVIDYPRHKLALNRLVNFSISILFALPYQDTTNAFKLYRREVIDGLQPFLSNHFNLTVELPLKSIVRGYSYAVVPNDWINRTTGVSKLKLKEMGSRYLFIILYCLIERLLSRGDYKKRIPSRSLSS